MVNDSHAGRRAGPDSGADLSPRSSLAVCQSKIRSCSSGNGGSGSPGCRPMCLKGSVAAKTAGAAGRDKDRLVERVKKSSHLSPAEVSLGPLASQAIARLGPPVRVLPSEPFHSCWFTLAESPRENFPRPDRNSRLSRATKEADTPQAPGRTPTPEGCPDVNAASGATGPSPHNPGHAGKARPGVGSQPQRTPSRCGMITNDRRRTSCSRRGARRRSGPRRSGSHV